MSSAEYPAPTLSSDRLLFRGPTRDDFAESVAMWSDPEVTRFIAAKPLTPEESWSRLCRNIGHWCVMGFGYWIVRDHAGVFVGEVGFADWKRDVSPPLDAPEAGWVLASTAQGRGYATEAVRAILAWGDQRFGSRRSACMIEPGNVKSVRVAEKCGYLRQPDGVYRGKPTLLFIRS